MSLQRKALRNISNLRSDLRGQITITSEWTSEDFYITGASIQQAQHCRDQSCLPSPIGTDNRRFALGIEIEGDVFDNETP